MNWMASKESGFEYNQAAKTPADPVTAVRPWSRRIRRAFLLYVLIPYLALMLIFIIFQRKLLYRPIVAESLKASEAGLHSEFARDIQIETPDGNSLNGWLLKATRQPVHPIPLVVYFPGNSLNRAERIADFREFTSRGFDVLVFDYRGFGDSSGAPTEQSLTADARLVWEYARDYVNGEENRIVIFGESLGGAVALSLWSKDNSNPPLPASLILNSTFCSLSETVSWHYPMFPFQYFLLDRWPSSDRIGNVKSPMVIFHGTADEMIPIEQGRELAEIASNARFIEIPGGEHNDIPLRQLQKELDRIRSMMTGSDSESNNDP